MTGALLLAPAGCSEDSAPSRPEAEPTAEPTPLGDYDTTDLTLVRGEFCDRVADAAVLAALEEQPTRRDSWSPGARLPGTRDISNEFGCAWMNGSVKARAWVFAPPISASRAADFAAETVPKDCERLATASTPGSPGAAQHCARGPGLTGVYGLVGDAWVGCEIAGTDDVTHVGEWCVAVLDALRTA